MTDSKLPKIAAGKAALLLAPMEGVLDAPLRQVYSEIGGFSFGVSEFIRVSATPTPPRVLSERIPELQTGCRAPGGLPIQVQLLGSVPVLLAETALRAAHLGAWAIDLNFGCPAVTVNRNGAGAVLLRTPKTIGVISRAVRAAIGKDVALSAKIRLGWDDPSEAEAVCRELVDAGVDWIVVHARTRQQGYTGHPNWEPVTALLKWVPVPLVVNGDISDVASLRKCRDTTGACQFMVGRGALADPSLAWQLADEVGLECSAPAFSLGDKFSAAEPISWEPILRRFAAICDGAGARPGYALRRVKQWLGYTAQIHPSARAWVEPLKRATSIADIFAMLR